MHVGGSFNTTRAAWPHMVEQHYGRIVMTTSAGLFGLPQNLSYATAKGAVIGLTRSLNTAAAAHGIKVNLIAPAAVTRMAGRATTKRHRCHRISSRRLSRSSRTRTARSAARSTRPAQVASRRSSSPRRRATCTRDRSRRWKTSPTTGRRSTTRPATPCRPTSPTGRRRSCPTCVRRRRGTARRAECLRRGRRAHRACARGRSAATHRPWRRARPRA